MTLEEFEKLMQEVDTITEDDFNNLSIDSKSRLEIVLIEITNNRRTEQR